MIREKKRTWKFLNQIFESSNEKVRIWSTKGFVFLAVGGTPKICRYVSSQNFGKKIPNAYRLERERERAYMCKEFFYQTTPLRFVKALVKTDEAPASLQTVPRHLQFVHSMHVLYMHLHTWPIRCFCCPEVQVFMSSRFEV